MSADHLDRIEQRAADCADALTANRYGSPVATGWYAQDVPALVRAARAARAIRKYHAFVPDAEAMLALDLALAELEGGSDG